jgi:hypothetical protein
VELVEVLHPMMMVAEEEVLVVLENHTHLQFPVHIQLVL